MSTIINILPGWTIATLLFAMFWIASILGSRWRQRMGSHGETLYATAAAVSLLALMVGFTFSLALNRYDTRRELVVEETAAIYSAWQRSQFQAEPQRAEMLGLVRAYADQRLRYFTFGIDPEGQENADARADAIVTRMWSIARTVSARDVQSPVTRMLVDSMGRIDDVAWRREAMAREHIPYLVVDLLVVFALLTAVSMGFSGVQGWRIQPAHLIFFGLVSAGIMLVIDLDRPRSGLVLVSQRPMIEALADMNAAARLPHQVLKP